MTTTSSLVILTLLIISLLSGKSYCSKGNVLRFFQVDNYLFASNSTHYWHVFSSQADGTNRSRGGALRFNMVGPHRLLMEEESANNNEPQTEDLKFIFVARLQEGCTLLVFVDSSHSYRLWRIGVSTNLSESIATFKAPFYLHKPPPNGNCGQFYSKKVPETGHLTVLPFFAGIFNHDQTSVVSSVFNSEHSSVLHVLFSGSGDSNSRYGTVYLNQSAHHWASSLANATDVTDAATSKLLQGKIAALYSRDGTQKKFMLLQQGNDTRVCPVASLTPSLVLKDACKTITTYYSYKKQQKLGRGSSLELEGGEDHRHSNGTTSIEKGSSTLLIMVVTILVAFLLIILSYIIITKFCCQASAAVIPYSGVHPVPSPGH